MRAQNACPAFGGTQLPLSVSEAPCSDIWRGCTAIFTACRLAVWKKPVRPRNGIGRRIEAGRSPSAPGACKDLTAEISGGGRPRGCRRWVVKPPRRSAAQGAQAEGAKEGGQRAAWAVRERFIGGMWATHER